MYIYIFITRTSQPLSRTPSIIFIYIDDDVLAIIEIPYIISADSHTAPLRRVRYLLPLIRAISLLIRFQEALD